MADLTVAVFYGRCWVVVDGQICDVQRVTALLWMALLALILEIERQTAGRDCWLCRATEC